MHAGLPVRSIIPTIDAPVLTVLAGTTKPLPGRDVASRSSRARAIQQWVQSWLA